MIELLDPMTTKEAVVLVMTMMFFGNLIINFILYFLFSNYFTGKILKRMNAFLSLVENKQ